MKKHVTAVAAIQIGFSSLWLILAVVIYFAISFARSQVGGDEVAEKSTYPCSRDLTGIYRGNCYR